MTTRKAKTRSALVLLLLSLLLSACGGDPLSSDAFDELAPVWLVDANLDSGQTTVKALVKSESLYNEADLQSLGLADLFGVQEQQNNAEILSPIASVRLSGGDVMHAIANGRSHQLYRRTRDLLYQTQFALLADQTNYDLRLSYAGNRFEPSTSSVDLFLVEGFASPDTNATVPSTGTINATWRVENNATQGSSTYTQRLNVALVSCSEPVSASEQLWMMVPASERAVSLAVSELPTPRVSQSAAGSATITCNYEFRLIGVSTSADTFDINAVPDQPAADVDSEAIETPIVLLVSRSDKLHISVEFQRSVAP